MSLGDDLRHGGRIGRAEFVRSARRYRRDRRRLLGLAVAALFLGGSLLVALPAVYALGLAARTVNAIPLFDTVGTLLPIGILLIAALRTLERLGAVDVEALLLTTVHPRAVVVGLVTAEVGRVTLWFGVPILATAGAFALGLGAPLFVASAALVLVPLVGCATIWGYALGIAVLRALRALPSVRFVVKVLGILSMFFAVVLSQFAGQYIAENDVSIREPLALLSAPLLPEYLSLAFVVTPLSGSVTPGGFLVLLALIGLTPVGLVVAERQATALWLTDSPDENARRRARERQRPPSHFAPPRPFSLTKSGRIAWGLLLRAARKPQELVHLLVIVFFVVPVAGPLFVGSEGANLAYLAAGTSVVLGVYLSGAAFGLNPLGDDRPHLPLLLLTGTTPARRLHGRILAGLAVGLPFASAVPLVVLSAIGAPLLGVAFALGGVGWCLLAAPFALGLGCGYPIYEERELWGAETVAPSTLVTMAYTYVVGGGTCVGLVLVWFVLSGALQPSGPVLAGLAAYLLATIGIPYGSYRYANRRYGGYVLE